MKRQSTLALAAFLLLSACGVAPHDALAPTVNVDEAYRLYQEGAFFLDVRTPEEWREVHAPNSTLIPIDELQARLDEVPRDRPVVVVCYSGNRSGRARELLVEAGFIQVTSMSGGLTEWIAMGYPTTTGP